MKKLALMLALGTDLKLAQPPDAVVDDQWFREVPAARLILASGSEISVTRYDDKNPAGLKPSSFPAALTNAGDLKDVKKAVKTYGKRKVARYELVRPALKARAADFDEYADVLGPGEPGVRSFVKRCVEAGVYQVPAAFNEALDDKDPKGLANFKRLFLDNERSAKQIEACLGFPLLAQMRRGERVKTLPKPPDEAELKRREKAVKAVERPEGRESVAVVEGKGRFYVLRLSADKSRYKKDLEIFDKVLTSLEVK